MLTILIQFIAKYFWTISLPVIMAKISWEEIVTIWLLSLILFLAGLGEQTQLYPVQQLCVCVFSGVIYHKSNARLYVNLSTT